MLQEAEFQTKALETVNGLTNTKQKVRRSKRESPHTFFGRSNVRAESINKCRATTFVSV